MQRMHFYGTATLLTWCAGLNAAAAQDAASDGPILLEVLSARVPASRASGGAWDAAPQEQGNIPCDLARVGSAMYSGSGEAGEAAGRLCSLLIPMPPRPDAPPTDPDVFVELDLGAGRSRIRTPVSPDSVAPEWRFAMVVDVTSLPASLIGNLIDSDPDGRRDPITVVVIPRDDVLLAAQQGAIFEVAASDGSVLRLRATHARSTPFIQPQSWEFPVPSQSDAIAAPLGDGVIVPIGARVRVEARGRVQLGDAQRFGATDASGSPDPSSRSFSLEGDAFRDFNFGALIMLLGSEGQTRQVVAPGSCIELTATQSGVPIFTINDRSRAHNSGELQIRLTVSLPGEVSPASANDVGCAAEPTSVVPRPRTAAPSRFAGVVDVVAPMRKANGDPWDADGSAPDLFLVISQARRTVTTTATGQDRLRARFELPLVEPSLGPLVIEVWDRDLMANDRVGTVVLDVANGQLEGGIDNAGRVQIVPAVQP